MTEIPKELLQDERFYHFVQEAFNEALAASTLEEMVVYAFGSVEEAIEKFNKPDE